MFLCIQHINIDTDITRNQRPCHCGCRYNNFKAVYAFFVNNAFRILPRICSEFCNVNTFFKIAIEEVPDHAVAYGHNFVYTRVDSPLISFFPEFEYRSALYSQCI